MAAVGARALKKLLKLRRASSIPPRYREENLGCNLLELTHNQALPWTTPRTSHSQNSQLSWQCFLDSFSVSPLSQHCGGDSPYVSKLINPITSSAQGFLRDTKRRVS